MDWNATTSSRPAATAFRLDRDEVRVWSLDVADPGTALADCVALLTQEERERLQTLRVGLPREEFILGRACLRVLLALALQVDPRDVVLTASSSGKPQVKGVEFNIAHSHGRLLIALCLSATVGVDIERISSSIEALDIATENFTAAERMDVENAANDADRARIFFRTWTRKEAVVKAHGGGLLLPIATIETGNSGADCPVQVSDAHANSSIFFVHDLDAGRGFAAALAIGASGLAVRVEQLGWASFKALLDASLYLAQVGSVR